MLFKKVKIIELESSNFVQIESFKKIFDSFISQIIVCVKQINIYFTNFLIDYHKCLKNYLDITFCI